MNKDILTFARHLRQNMTHSEKILWTYLRAKRLNGHKILRQHPIIYHTTPEGKQYSFFLDFYCDEAKLAIELDGGIHIQQLEYDKQRDAILLEKGIDTLRIKNEELKDIELVLDNIKQYFQKRLNLLAK